MSLALPSGRPAAGGAHEPDVVRLTVNGTATEVHGGLGRRLLDVLREDLGLTGAKEGCGEGECGTCAVLVDGRLVNACLVPLEQVDGSAVLTVEGLAGADGLSRLQQAFLDLGGTQCGMCAGGMLLAAQALLEQQAHPGADAVRTSISGNLCRCTGYTKVVEAISAASGQTRTPARKAGNGRAATSTPPTVIRAATGMAGRGHPAVVRPRSLADALDRLHADPGLRPIAGGTDLMPALSADATPPTDARLLDLWHLDELRGIAVIHDELVLGAGATWAEVLASPIAEAALPALAEAASTMGAPAIRNRATVGGNCVTASPAADLPPLLLVTDALLDVVGPDGPRTIGAGAFWTGYRTTALRPGELLRAVRIPLVPGRSVRFRKLGGRAALAIAVVSLAVAWQHGDPERGDLGRSGTAVPPGALHADPWRDVRIALGSVAPTVIRAAGCEALLEGRAPDPSIADAVARSLRDEIQPIDDVRATASYRRSAASRMLRRIVLDAASDTAQG